MLFKLLVLSLCMFSLNTFAEGADKESVKKAQEVLKDPKQVKEITNKDAKAKKADDFVKNIAGSEENAQEVYNIAAELMPVLLEMNNNDPEKAVQSLQDYAKNPKAFLDKLPETSRKKIKALAEKIESEKKKKP